MKKNLKKMSLILLSIVFCINILAFSSFAEAGIKLTAKALNGTQIQLSWSKLGGAQKYEVYRSAKEDSGYKLIVTTKNTKFLNKNLPNEKLYFYKVRAILDGEKKYSDFSKAVSAKTIKPVTYKEGKYLIGKDIPEGKYVLVKTPKAYSSYYATYTDDSYSFSNIINNGSFNNNMIFEAIKGEYLELQQCTAYKLLDAYLDRSGSGQFMVGLHIEPGEYVLKATQSTSLRQDIADMYLSIYPKNGESKKIDRTFENNAIITLKDSDIITLIDCDIFPIKGTKLDTTKAGMFKVGTHIKAGKYKVVKEKDKALAYAIVINDTRLRDADALEMATLSGNETKTYTLKDGQYIMVRGGKIEKIG